VSGLSRWCRGTVSIKLNDSYGPYIKSFQGVRQGDPLSPILFNFVVDCLTRMVLKAQDNELFSRLVEQISLRGVAICNMQMTPSFV